MPNSTGNKGKGSIKVNLNQLHARDFIRISKGIINKVAIFPSLVIKIIYLLTIKINNVFYGSFQRDCFLGRFNANYNKPLFFTPHGMFTFKRLKFNLMEKGSIEETYYKELERKAIEFASQLIILSDSFRDSLTDMRSLIQDRKSVV